METNLRPMTLGEILDRTAQLYRQNFLLFAGIASAYAGGVLVVGLAETGVQEWLRLAHQTGALLWSTGAALLVTYVAIFISRPITEAANNRAVAWLYLGEPATIRGAYQSILPKVWRYLWLGLLKVIFGWLPLIAVYAGLAGIFIFLGMKGIFKPGAPPAPPASTSAGMIVSFIVMGILFLLALPAVIYGVIMELRYSLAVPASVVEDLKARAAIKRSIALSKWSRGRIFVLRLLVWVIEVGLASLTQGFFVFAAMKNHGQLAVGWRVVQQFVGFCTTTFVAPILSTGLTLFYYDQRIRKEGYDIEWMMQAAGMTVPVTLPPAQAATTEPPVWTAVGEPAAMPMSNGQAPVELHAAETVAVEDPEFPSSASSSDLSAGREPGNAHE